MDYSKAGVNLELGDEASKIFYNAAKETFANRSGNIGEVIVPFDDFSGVRAIDVSRLPPGSLMCMGFDGVGTKVEIAQRMDDHSTIAFDLFAMVCDDAIVRGAEPVLIGSILDLNSLGDNIEKIKQLAKGYVEAAKYANVAVINGEIAELGDSVRGYGKFNYHWCSTIVWFANKNKLFTGKEVKVNDSVVVFKDKGFRSNGFSLVRKVFSSKLGDDWHNKDFEGKKLGLHVLEPSKIYSKAVVSMHGGFKTPGNCEVHGVVHVTGGGIPEKLGRVLKNSGFGAELTDLFDPCPAMKYCQELGEISDVDAYRAWNMGNGLMIITPEPSKVISEALKFGIEAQVAGKIISEKIIKIKSKGKDGGELLFSL